MGETCPNGFEKNYKRPRPPKKLHPAANTQEHGKRYFPKSHCFLWMKAAMRGPQAEARLTASFSDENCGKCFGQGRNSPPAWVLSTSKAPDQLPTAGQPGEPISFGRGAPLQATPNRFVNNLKAAMRGLFSRLRHAAVAEGRTGTRTIQRHIDG